MYHAHVQHPRGSGYMMQTGRFRNAGEAVTAYLELVDADDNPFGRLALANKPEPLRVTLIPAVLRGTVMAYMGQCSIWNEDGSDAYETEAPDSDDDAEDAPVSE